MHNLNDFNLEPKTVKDKKKNKKEKLGLFFIGRSCYGKHTYFGA